jgi:hypothetical protein
MERELRRMKAWLYAQDRAGQSLVPIQIVFNRNQAIEMTENNAHEMMRAAESTHPQYTWGMVGVGCNLFIVEGTEKKK